MRLLLLCLLLTACAKPLTPEEMAKEVKRCHDNGLDVYPVYGSEAMTAVTHIQCVPR
jgi:hypothetical protein